ncbi:protein of unknown function [Cupriavidus taiwanensis]|uniref:Uncharacterized protein n=1 Tax=Cupriavidus taiwanensis TaxID=164546 RepID=A0A9Q7URE9_9BURK|nr:protein of unknown function [Cupriavidus taiwanensis]
MQSQGIGRLLFKIEQGQDRLHPGADAQERVATFHNSFGDFFC